MSIPASLAAAQMVEPSATVISRPSIVSVTVRGVACTGMAMYSVSVLPRDHNN